jgi:acyl-CoA synthetase (AMP-forming)/AMP-acid ligase II/acyl carrier protein
MRVRVDRRGDGGEAGTSLVIDQHERELVMDLIQLLQERAATHPRQGYRFLIDGDADGPTIELNYQELDARAKSIAVALQEISQPGDRALLLYPPGLDYIAGFFGCLYAGVIAVPAYPPETARLSRTLPRVLSILSDAEAHLILSTEALCKEQTSFIEHAPLLQKARFLATDTLKDRSIEWSAPQITEDSIAFLQYTSGSTSSPKGVIVTHQNLLHTLEDMGVGWDHHEQSVLVSWLPTFHDLGLIYGVLQPLFGGFRGVLFSPSAFLQQPLRWLRAISKYRGTHSAAPNFAFDLCSKKAPIQEHLDLSCWRVSLNAAEPVRAETISRFHRVFAPYGLRETVVTPGYGLAEATLKVSTVHADETARSLSLSTEALSKGRVVLDATTKNTSQIVSCGRATLGAVIEIVDPETKTRTSGVGEIWVQSRSVAKGYWGRPTESAETFLARLSEKGGPFLRTGDLGFLYAGELFITGRLKDLIIIDGKNFYPQDLELTATNVHPGLRPGCGAAFSMERDGVEHAVLIQEFDTKKYPAAELKEIALKLGRALQEQHELSLQLIVFLKAGAILKTSSGKIQRRACRAALFSGSLEPVYVWEATMSENNTARTKDSIERWLFTEVGKVCGVHPADLDPSRPLDEMGLKSSQIASLTGDLERWLGKKVSQTAFWEHSTIAALSEHLSA